MRQGTVPAIFVLALACLAAQPSDAQSARVCLNEVQRLSDTFALTRPGQQDGGAITQAPSARQGASLGKETQKQIDGLVQEARKAGENGDGPGCVQKLAEARTLLRQAGIGSNQPGMVAGGGSVRPGSVGTTGTGMTRGAGSAGTLPDTAGTTGTMGGTAGSGTNRSTGGMSGSTGSGMSSGGSGSSGGGSP